MDFFDMESLAEWCGDGDVSAGSCLGPGAADQPHSSCSQPTQIPHANNTSWQWQWLLQGMAPQQQINHSWSLPSTPAIWAGQDAGNGQFHGRPMSWPGDDGTATTQQRPPASHDQLSSSPSGSDDSFSSHFLQHSPSPASQAPLTVDDELLLQDIASLQTMEEQGMVSPVPDIHTENVMFAMEPDNIGNNQSLHSSSFFETYSKLPALPLHAEQTWTGRTYPSPQNTWQWSETSTLTLPVIQPAITVVHQPPENYRARYEKEANEAPKGFLKDAENEPVAVQLENLPLGVGDIAVTVSVVTSKGVLHPTIYASCFGRSMPSDWKENKVNRTVTTTMRATENHRKSLRFLAIKRNTQDGTDLRGHTKHELSKFCIKFEASVPSPAGDRQSVTTMTKPVHVMCPSTSTKHRRRQREQFENIALSPSKTVRV